MSTLSDTILITFEFIAQQFNQKGEIQLKEIKLSLHTWHDIPLKP